MSGFDNDIMFAKNADFTQADNQAVSESNGLATNGQLWIGATTLNAGGTHINVGTLTSPDASVTIGYSSPNITLQAAIPPTTMTFIDQGSSITLASDTGYFVTASTTQTLPVGAAQGDLIIIICDTAGAVTVAPGAGQTLRLGSSTSATSLVSTARGDCLSLRYRSATTTWFSEANNGNWTVS